MGRGRKENKKAIILLIEIIAFQLMQEVRWKRIDEYLNKSTKGGNDLPPIQQFDKEIIDEVRIGEDHRPNRYSFNTKFNFSNPFYLRNTKKFFKLHLFLQL